MNGAYTPSFFLANQYADYTAAGLTSIHDSLIPEENYTSEIVPWVKKLTRFIVGEYNETYVDGDRFKANVKNVWAEFQIEMFATPLEAKEWIRANTNLVERSEWVFVIHLASTSEMGEVAEKLLVIG